MSFPGSDPVGVVLAGGLGRRLGGSKASVSLNGRPLIAYPVQAVQQVLDDVVIAAKADTELPSLPGVAVWIEPQKPCHPLVGVLHALELAGGRSVLICACDLPLVTPELIRAVWETDPGDGCAVVARSAGRSQPLLACYQASARAPLSRALEDELVPVMKVVEALGPRYHDVEDPSLLFNVNTPEDLLRAGALLSTRARAGESPPAGQRG